MNFLSNSADLDLATGCASANQTVRLLRLGWSVQVKDNIHCIIGVSEQRLKVIVTPLLRMVRYAYAAAFSVL